MGIESDDLWLGRVFAFINYCDFISGIGSMILTPDFPWVWLGFFLCRPSTFRTKELGCVDVVIL